MGTSETYKGFPWRPGMLTTDGERVVRVDDGVVTGWQDMDTASWHVTSLVGMVVQPDLTDPATIGALAGAVREAWGLPDLYAKPLLPEGWAIARPFTLPDICQPDVWARSEGEAWLDAYHAHPSVAGVA